MKKTVHNSPAHKIFINQFIDWELVQSRLSRYGNIGSAFSIDFLRGCANNPPYYCHYLAWRLGTWKSESIFEHFDNLLGFGLSIDNWQEKKSLLNSSSFDDFWGLIWELQVARFFADKKNAKINWTLAGPDLKVSENTNEFYVECYTYRKSFGVEEFVSELFHHIHPQIRVEHISCLKFNLPKNGTSEIERFLSELFEPYLDAAFLHEKVKKSQEEWPVLLPLPDGTTNFFVYLEGNVEHYNSGIIVNAAGPPELYLEHSIAEAVDNKRKSNKLHEHRPNVLAINFLLGADFQLAFNHQVTLKQEIPIPKLDPEIDGLMIACCGIDEFLSTGNSILIVEE